MLAVAAQAHALLELVHIVDMLHPLGIDIAQQADALQFAHRLFAVALLLRGQDIHAALVQLISNALAGQLTQLLGGVVEVGGQAQPVHKVAAQTGKIPIIGRFAVQVVCAGIINGLAHHLMQLAGDILAVQHHLALLIDDLALLVHDIVILQHLFTNCKVRCFELFLGALDRVGDELVLDGDIFVKAQGVHQVLHALAAENTHQVILKAQEEAGGAGVTLTAGTAAQLVVDTAALVPLCANDEQTACGAHLVGLGVDGRLILGVQLLKALTCRQNVGIGGLAVAVGFGQQQLHGCRVGILRGIGVEQVLAEVLLAHLGFRHELGVAA